MSCPSWQRRQLCSFLHPSWQYTAAAAAGCLGLPYAGAGIAHITAIHNSHLFTCCPQRSHLLAAAVAGATGASLHEESFKRMLLWLEFSQRIQIVERLSEAGSPEPVSAADNGFALHCTRDTREAADAKSTLDTLLHREWHAAKLFCLGLLNKHSGC